MKKPLKELCGLLPADAQTPEVLEPADGTFHGPTPCVAAERTSILGNVFRLAIAAVGRDHLDPFYRHRFIKPVAVIGLVANDSLGGPLREHEVKQPLNQGALVGCGRHRIDRYRKPSRIDQNHDFYAFSDSGTPDTIAAATSLAEGAVDETLVELVLPSFFDEPAGIAHEGLEDPFADPPLKPTMHRAFGAEFGWKILPFGPVVENPEDALNDLSFVGRRAASKRASRWVWNPFRKPIQLRWCEC